MQTNNECKYYWSKPIQIDEVHGLHFAYDSQPPQYVGMCKHPTPIKEWGKYDVVCDTKHSFCPYNPKLPRP